MSTPVITLTTDFGLVDAYVGIMKGVILGICPSAAVVDISHGVRPGAVGQAAYLLKSAVGYFPPGTVHLVVVDPGVGSERRPVAVRAERATYVAPDNGVLSQALAWDPPRTAVQLTRPEYRLPQVSTTFHGRDIFAPAAAHLACGVDPGDMGEEISATDLVLLPALEPTLQSDGWRLGQVLHVDRFGNLVTNHPIKEPAGRVAGSRAQEEQVPAGARVLVSAGGRQILGLHRTYSDVDVGDLVAYAGSSGTLEIAVREGSARAVLGLDVGAPVLLKVEG